MPSEIFPYVIKPSVSPSTLPNDFRSGFSSFRSKGKVKSQLWLVAASRFAAFVTTSIGVSSRVGAALEASAVSAVAFDWFRPGRRTKKATTEPMSTIMARVPIARIVWRLEFDGATAGAVRTAPHDEQLTSCPAIRDGTASACPQLVQLKTISILVP